MLERVGMSRPLKLAARSARAVFAVILTAALSACGGGQQLTRDYFDFAEAYADSSNRQMLTNLARRDNGHPAYFLQLGAITATHVQTASVNAGVSRTRSRTETGGVVAALTTVLAPNANVGISHTEQPTFSFTPLAGKSFADALFNPLNQEMLFKALAQGQDANVVLRMLVQSVTFDWPSTGFRKVLVNVPDEDRFGEFRDFLKLAGLMRELQIRQLLAVDTTTDAAGKQAHALRFLDPGAIGKLIAGTPHFNYLESVPSDLIDGPPKVTFTLRTFDGILAALSTEHAVFEYLATTHGEKFLEQIPPSERQAILRTRWEGNTAPTTAPTVQVQYRGVLYEVKDLLKSSTTRSRTSRWNRDVFVFLNQLFTIVSLDPADLPAQQLIQIK